jgi:hypothetical protein
MRAHTGICGATQVARHLEQAICAATQVAIAAETRLYWYIWRNRLRGTWRMLAVPLAAAATLLYMCPHTATQVARHLEHA